MTLGQEGEGNSHGLNAADLSLCSAYTFKNHGPPLCVTIRSLHPEEREETDQAVLCNQNVHVGMWKCNKWSFSRLNLTTPRLILLELPSARNASVIAKIGSFAAGFTLSHQSIDEPEKPENHLFLTVDAAMYQKLFGQTNSSGHCLQTWSFPCSDSSVFSSSWQLGHFFSVFRTLTSSLCSLSRLKT